MSHDFTAPPNTVHEFSLTPNLRRRLRGESTSSTVYSRTIDEKVSFNQVTCITVSTSNIAIDGSETIIDNIPISDSELILVNGQDDNTENGVYYASTSDDWERYTGIENTPLVIVKKGEVNQDTGWLLLSDDIVYDETGIKFRQVFPYDGVLTSGIENSIAKNSLQIASVDSKINIFESARYDGLQMSTDNFSINDYGQALTFINEVLNGNRFATTATTGTQFFCNKTGLYSVHANVDITLTYVTDPEFKFHIELAVFRNGIGYSTLSKDAVSSFHDPAYVNLYEYSLNGSDLIGLTEGDSVDLRLWSDQNIATNTPTITEYGYFCIKLEDCDYTEINSANNKR